MFGANEDLEEIYEAKIKLLKAKIKSLEEARPTNASETWAPPRRSDLISRVEYMRMIQDIVVAFCSNHAGISLTHIETAAQMSVNTTLELAGVKLEDDVK